MLGLFVRVDFFFFFLCPRLLGEVKNSSFHDFTMSRTLSIIVISLNNLLCWNVIHGYIIHEALRVKYIFESILVPSNLLWLGYPKSWWNFMKIPRMYLFFLVLGVSLVGYLFFF